MIEVDTLAELASYVGQEVGVSDWLLVDQALVDQFAHLTGDLNWYHVDKERAARELPDGLPIAHGLLTLSLIPGMAGQIVRVLRHGRAFNYGFDKVRFPAPVQVGARVRLRMHVLSAEKDARGTMLKRQYTMEIDGHPKPAMIAEMLSLIV